MADFVTARIVEPAIINERKKAKGQPYEIVMPETVGGEAVFNYIKGELIADDLTPEQGAFLATVPGFQVDGYPLATRQAVAVQDWMQYGEIEAEKKKLGVQHLPTAIPELKELMTAIAARIGEPAAADVARKASITRKEIAGAKPDAEAQQALVLLASNNGVEVEVGKPGWNTKLYAEIAKLAKGDSDIDEAVREILDESEQRAEIAAEEAEAAALNPATPEDEDEDDKKDEQPEDGKPEDAKPEGDAPQA